MRPTSYRKEGPCCRNCSDAFVLATNPGDGCIVHHFCKHSDAELPADTNKPDLSAQSLPFDYVWMGKRMVDPNGICDEYSKK